NGPNGNGTPGAGLYNLAELDTNGDGQPDSSDDACGDLPNVELAKTFVSAMVQPDGSYNVVYTIAVTNNGGATGTYGLTDTPSFDDDVTINGGTFSGEASGTLTTGTTTLTTNNSIAAGATETFTLTYNVTLDLTAGSTDGGDNVYTACGSNGPNGNGTPGAGLYNLAELDTNGDGQPDSSDDACGDLPNVELAKTFVSATVQPDGSYNVVYTIAVTNNGGATGTYGLTDTPAFDNDVTINGGTFSGEASGTLTAGTTTLTTNNSIAAGATETFTLTYNVTLDLTAGSTDGGDNVYTACGNGGPNGEGTPGQGLYNTAYLDTNGDGQPDSSDDACGDLPNLLLDKEFVSATPNADGTYTVVYTIAVTNNGGATGTYGLTDTPSFEDDVTINSGSFAGEASGQLNVSGVTTLTVNNSIAAGATETFTLTYIVTLDLEPGSTDGGDNVYTACVGGSEEGITGTPGTGLYNRADLDTNNDGQPDLSDDDCGDLPLFDLALDKNLVPASAPYQQGSAVTYTVTVTNEGEIDAANVEVTDTPETGLVFSSITPQAGITGTGNGSFTIASLPVGSSVTVTLNYTISNSFQGTTLNNAAEITEDGPFDDIDSDPETGDDVDEDGDGDGDDDDEDNVDITIDQTYDLALTKDLTSAGPYTQGATVSYNITVTNQGSLNAATVVVEDRPQAGLTYAGLNSGDVTDNGDGTFTLNNTLAQGASLTFNVSYTIDATFQGTSLTNVAEITEDDGDDEDSTPDNDVPTEDDQDDETITVDQTYDLALTKDLT
ncbi:DUF11 domain-containing protein, partial [Lewinella lacunae]